jgi:transcriptional regulator with XRE-family HTH domain
MTGLHLSELGEMLRSTREKRRISLAEAARATRIKESYLEALEDGDFSQLPGAAYVTGFLRNYSSFLGLHPDDMVQEYRAIVPPPQPDVKPSTRVLASGYERYNRTRLLWGLAVLILLLAGGYAIKQYNDTYAHPYSGPSLTPANLGGSDPAVVHRAPQHVTFSVQLRAVAPTWVRVTRDNFRVFQGILRSTQRSKAWSAHHSIYVVTYDGAHLSVAYNGHPLGRMARHPGLVIELANPSGWHRVS